MGHTVNGLSLRYKPVTYEEFEKFIDGYPRNIYKISHVTSTFSEMDFFDTMYRSNEVPFRLKIAEIIQTANIEGYYEGYIVLENWKDWIERSESEKSNSL